MKVTGHKTNSMFKRYNVVAEQDLAEAMKRVSEYRQAHDQRIVTMAVR